MGGSRHQVHRGIGQQGLRPWQARHHQAPKGRHHLLEQKVVLPLLQQDRSSRWELSVLVVGGEVDSWMLSQLVAAIGMARPILVATMDCLSLSGSPPCLSWDPTTSWLASFRRVENRFTNPHFLVSVNRVIGDWVSDVLEMHSDLVG